MKIEEFSPSVLVARAEFYFNFYETLKNEQEDQARIDEAYNNYLKYQQRLVELGVWQASGKPKDQAQNEHK